MRYLHPGEEKGEENRAKTIIKIMTENPKASMSMIAKKTGMTKRQIEKTIMRAGRIHSLSLSWDAKNENSVSR